ncbi:MAG: hypothetical protein C4527_14485 [Candidatus Omnitrophota bacterium]|jgi:hypothetical protein|nr:MAG: hypothetical protein C4527_14485 [Candidatus Omnitrophota bacterium]
MYYFELGVYTLIGLAGVVYAYHSHRVRFSLPDLLPGILGNRKIIFSIGLGVVLAGFVLDSFIGIHHQIITLAGGWFMLLGSAPWFNRRIVRRLFDPVEWRIIRITMYAGFGLTIVSSGWLWLPSHFSGGTFLIGIAHMVLAGRLWWNQDLSANNSHMVFSKRDYS